MDTNDFIKRCTLLAADDGPDYLRDEGVGYGMPSSSSTSPGRNKSSRRPSLGGRSLASSYKSTMSKSAKRKWIAVLDDAVKNHVWNQADDDTIPDIDDVTLDRLADVPSDELCAVFIEAIRTGNLEAAKILLNPRIDRLDINAVDEEFRTALHWAIFERHTDFAINFILPRSDVNITTPDAYGETPLAIAAERGLTEIAKRLVPMYPRAINIHNDEKWTPFHTAVDNNHLEIVKIFIEQLENSPISQNDRTCFYQQKDDGETILHIAAYRGNNEIMKRLLNHLMNVCARTRDVDAVLTMVDDEDGECIDRAQEEQHADIVHLIHSTTAMFDADVRFETKETTYVEPTPREEAIEWACGAWGVHRCPFESETHQCFPMGEVQYEEEYTPTDSVAFSPNASIASVGPIHTALQIDNDTDYDDGVGGDEGYV